MNVSSLNLLFLSHAFCLNYPDYFLPPFVNFFILSLVIIQFFVTGSIPSMVCYDLLGVQLMYLL